MSPGEPVADEEELREFAHNMLSEDGEAAPEENGADALPPEPPAPAVAASVQAPVVVPAAPQQPPKAASPRAPKPVSPRAAPKAGSPRAARKAASPRAAPKHDPLNTAALEEMMRAKEEQVRETGLFFQRTTEPDPPAMGGQPTPTQPNGAEDSAEPMLPLQPAQEQGPASTGGSDAASGPPPPSEPPPPASKRPAPPASDNDEQSKTLKPKPAGGAEAEQTNGAAGSDGAGGPDEPPKKKRRYPKPKPRQMWTEEEHKTFCDAIQKHGRDWSRVTEIIGTKTVQQVILPTASGVSNEGGSSPLLALLPAVSWPWVPAWGSLEPSRRDGENAQKTGKNGAKMGEIRPKKCEPRELTKDQLAGPLARAEALQADPA